MAIASAYFSSNCSTSVSTNSSGSSQNVAALSLNTTPASGTSSGQINLVFYPANPTASTTPLVYDLNGGGLLHMDGTTAFNLTTLCKLRVIGRATSGTATITVGGGTNPVMPAITVAAVNGCVDIEDFITGIAITPGSNDKLTITASAGTVAIEVYIAGR